MHSIKTILSIALVFNFAHAGMTMSRRAGCTIDLTKRQKVGTKESPPIYYSLKSGQIIYPTENNGALHIDDGDKIGIKCHSPIDKKLVKAQCKGGVFQNMDKNGQIVEAEKPCKGKSKSKRFEPKVQISEDKPCAEIGVDSRTNLTGSMVLVKIGWEIPEGSFLPQSKIFSSIYSMKNQVAVFEEEVNNNMIVEDGSKIIAPGKSQRWFARGHLSPDKAFIWDFEQFATYFYINVDPQFQTFNAENWLYAEKETRMMAKSKQRPMRVMQGSSHNLQYKNKNGDWTDVYLYYKKEKRNSKKNIDLPLNKYFWKVVHDFERNEAIAFVGINDPHWKATHADEKDELFKNVKSVCPEWKCYHPKTAEVREDGKMICASVEDVYKHGKLENFPNLSDRNGNWPALITREED